MHFGDALMQRTTCSALGSVQCTTTWCTWGCTCTGPCIDCPPCGQDTQTGRGCFRLHFLAAVSWCRRIYRRSVLPQNESDELHSNHIWMSIGSPTPQKYFKFFWLWGILGDPLSPHCKSMKPPWHPFWAWRTSEVESHHITLQIEEALLPRCGVC